MWQLTVLRCGPGTAVHSWTDILISVSGADKVTWQPCDFHLKCKNGSGKWRCYHPAHLLCLGTLLGMNAECHSMRAAHGKYISSSEHSLGNTLQDVLKAKCISRCLHRCIMITNLHSSPQHSLHLTSPFIGNVQLPSSVMALQFCNETPPSVMALQLCNKTPPSVMELQLCNKTPQSNHPRTVVISGWVHHYPLGYTHHIWKYSCILKIVTGVTTTVQELKCC